MSDDGVQIEALARLQSAIGAFKEAYANLHEIERRGKLIFCLCGIITNSKTKVIL